MIAAFVLTLAGAAQSVTPVSTARAQTAERTEIVAVSRSQDVPDEIVPAVMPYMLCSFAKRSGEIYSDGRRIDLSDQPENCDKLRSEAVEYGALLYEEYGIGESAEDRKERVKTFLNEFDAFQESVEYPFDDSTDAQEQRK